MGSDLCDTNAICQPKSGDYDCKCNVDGNFVGTGYQCEDKCKGYKCIDHSYCKVNVVTSKPNCLCLEGFHRTTANIFVENATEGLPSRYLNNNNNNNNIKSNNNSNNNNNTKTITITITISNY